MIFERMKQAVEHLLPAIHAHPFNRDLAKGSLSQEIFNFYVKQDALYIRDFSGALFLVSQRLPIAAHSRAFLNYREQIVRFESKLQSQYLRRSFSLGFHDVQFCPNQKIPAIERYTGHLLETAKKASVEVAVASLIPCFWVYNDLGRTMQYNPTNPYSSWIQSYSGEVFTAATQSITCIADEVGDVSSQFIQEKMIQAFTLSTKYEISFWDSVYHKSEYQHDANPETQFKYK